MKRRDKKKSRKFGKEAVSDSYRNVEGSKDKREEFRERAKELEQRRGKMKEF